MIKPDANLITKKLLGTLVLVTILVMIIFMFARYQIIQQRLKADLLHDAEIIATRVANAVRPTIWNIYQKSKDRSFSEDLTSAILDAEMLSQKVVAIRVYGNFGHLFMGRVRHKGEVVSYVPDVHKALIDSAYYIQRTPITLNSITIGNVEIALSNDPFLNSLNRHLRIELLQVFVIGILVFVIAFFVLQRYLIKPLLQIQIAKQTLETMDEAVVVISNSDQVMDANRAFYELSGLTKEELFSKNFKLNSLIEDPIHLRSTIREGLKRDQRWSGEITAHSKGKTIPAWIEISIIRDHKKRVAAFVIVIRDMTEQKEREEELERMAFNDPLTTLANRTSFERRLKHDIAVCERLNKPLCVFFIDLDDFKTVNDAFGHEAGDKLLIEVADRFKKRLRKSDTLARIGGDEFTVVLPDLQGNGDFEKLGKELISLAASPIKIGGSEVYVGASIGAALFPDDGKNITDLLKHADVAMYRAKSRGRNRIAFYSSEFESDSHARIALEAELRHAINNNAFELYYQAKVLMDTGEPTGYEALLRWKKEDGSFVPPSEFIPIAEERGLIIQLGRWIVHNAIQQIKEWQERYSKKICLAINISPVQFHDNELLDFLKREIYDANINPETIEIEITETTIIKDIHYSAEFLKALKALGVKVSIDDFGTGYSSLRYLQELPIDTLKIDRVFVTNIELANKNQAIAKTVISLADNLDLDVVVEGVEEEAQAHILTALGCEVGQGFYFSRPLPPDQVEQQLIEYFG